MFLFLIPIIYGMKVQIFMESQCPDTHRLIKQMQSALQIKDIENQIEFEYIMFGKGQQKQKADLTWEFECQHGEVECYGNRLETCAQQLLSWKEQLKLLGCMHGVKRKSIDDYDQAIVNCLKDDDCALEKTAQCMKEKVSNYLQHKAADITLAQNLTFVPWIVIDGVHDDELDASIRQDFMKWLCQYVDCSNKVE
ncbi:oxidoreductase activity protein [Paramecium bursaria]